MDSPNMVHDDDDMDRRHRHDRFLLRRSDFTTTIRWLSEALAITHQVSRWAWRKPQRETYSGKASSGNGRLFRASFLAGNRSVSQ